MQVRLEQRWIDRLVDGELTQEERRELLRLVDAEPDAWRRVGLAFLEAQAWREGGMSFATEAAEPESPPVTVPAVASTPRPVGVWSLAAGVAALAFTLGYAVRAVPSWTASAPAPTQGPAVAPVPRETLRRVGRIELTSSDGGESSGVEVPLYTGGVPPEWSSQEATPIPDEVRNHWEKLGYRVESRRELIAIGLGDGRAAVVPVEDVEARYVGRPVY